MRVPRGESCHRALLFGTDSASLQDRRADSDEVLQLDKVCAMLHEMALGVAPERLVAST